MKRVSGLMVLLLLSACAASGVSRDTADKIRQEKDAAAAVRESDAKPDTVNQALLRFTSANKLVHGAFRNGSIEDEPPLTARGRRWQGSSFRCGGA